MNLTDELPSTQIDAIQLDEPLAQPNWETNLKLKSKAT
jgi:hypothetical protein